MAREESGEGGALMIPACVREEAYEVLEEMDSG